MKYWILLPLVALPVRALAQSAADSPPQPFASDSWTSADQDFGISAGAFSSTARFGLSPGDHSQRFGNTGYMFSADYYHRVLGIFSMGLEGSDLIRNPRQIENATPNSVVYATTTPLPSITRVQGDSKNLMLMMRLRSTRKSGWRPYAAGGVGISSTHLQVYDELPEGYVWYSPPTYTRDFTVAQGNSLTMALTGRVGIDYASESGAALGIEAGYFHIPVSNYPLTSSAGYLSPPPTLTNVNSGGDGFTLKVRGSFRFGGGD